MGDISGPLAYLLLSWGLITVALVILLIYRATISSKEDDQLYLNKAEISMMGSDQAVVITRLHRLGKPIVALGDSFRHSACGKRESLGVDRP